MALPQCAMAHFGSRVAASEKVCSDSLYWNECSSATPFSTLGSTALEQVVGKLTLPSWSGGAADKLAPPSRKSTTKSGMAAFDWQRSRIGGPPWAWRRF